MYKNTTQGDGVESVKKQVSDFLNKCEEIRKCKFIMATTKIKDLLKSIVNSPELYELFNTVVSKFDYMAAKQRCLLDGNNGVYSNSFVVLPDTVGERLAFIFCLLVEFDRDEINFNSFLQRYYPKDGSYYASYHAFCDEVIVSLEEIIKDVFSAELQEGEAQPSTAPSAVDAKPDSSLASNISYITLLIARESDFVTHSPLPEDDKEAALKILNQLTVAVRACDKAQIEALVCGYNYFVSYSNEVSQDLDLLFNAIGEFVE